MRGLALWLLLAATPALADSRLDRLTSRAQSLGWEAVGRIDIGTQGYCTGTLIAPDLVLTAAHCFYENTTGARYDPRRMLFRAGLQDGRTVAQVRGRRAVVLQGYDPLGPSQLGQLQHDAALLQLAEAIPAAVAAPFAVGRAVGPGDRVSVVSYARGRDRAPSWQRDCRVRRQGQGALELSCAVDHGASGAPVFETSSGRARIVSIISRGRHDGRFFEAYGMEIAAPLNALKVALRAGRGVFPREDISGRRITSGTSGTRSAGGAKFIRP